MKTSAHTAPRGSLLAHLFLHYASPLAGARRVPLLGLALRWAVARLVPRETRIWIRIRGGCGQGLWMRVNPRTGQPTLWGSGEPVVQQVLVEHLRPSMTFYDLGANVGFFSLLGAKLVGPSGRVISFEADPEISTRLRENIAMNGFAHVIIEPSAVWSEPGTLPFARVDSASSPDRGQGHISKSAAGDDVISVQAISLDYYCKTNPVPDFIKCDVEGAEVEVFRGARQVFTNHRPIFLCELHGEAQRSVLNAELSALGYRCLECDATHLLALPR